MRPKVKRLVWFLVFGLVALAPATSRAAWFYRWQVNPDGSYAYQWYAMPDYYTLSDPYWGTRRIPAAAFNVPYCGPVRGYGAHDLEFELQRTNRELRRLNDNLEWGRW